MLALYRCGPSDRGARGLSRGAAAARRAQSASSRARSCGALHEAILRQDASLRRAARRWSCLPSSTPSPRRRSRARAAELARLRGALGTGARRRGIARHAHRRRAGSARPASPPSWPARSTAMAPPCCTRPAPAPPAAVRAMLARAREATDPTAGGRRRRRPRWPPTFAPSSSSLRAPSPGFPCSCSPTRATTPALARAIGRAPARARAARRRGGRGDRRPRTRPRRPPADLPESVLEESDGVPAPRPRGRERLGAARGGRRVGGGRRAGRRRTRRAAHDGGRARRRRDGSSGGPRARRPARRRRAPVVCPFKGLASFDVDDAEYFFGRERLVAELVARLVGAPLLGIVGPSGSGKSSVAARRPAARAGERRAAGQRATGRGR